MKEKAIFFTVYNRIEYLIPTLEQWLNVDSLDEFDIYFRVEPSDIREDILNEIKLFQNRVGAEVNIILNNEKQGCAKNTWNGFEELFKNYNFVILTEDDILPANDVCKYFNFLEKKYRDDGQVAAISANYEFDGHDESLVAKVPFFRGQIWGTWKNIWELYIRDTWDYAYDTAEDNGPAGWDWNMTLRVFPKNNLVCVVPHAARSQHIGINGIHCDEEVYSKTIMSSFKKERAWKELIEK